MLFHVLHVYLQTIHVSLFFSNKLSSLGTYMNHDLDKFCVWAIANKLSVYPNKSHAVIISP